MRIFGEVLAFLVAVTLASGQEPSAPAPQPDEPRTPAPASAAPSSAKLDYVLKPSDLIEVRVFQEPELDARARLGPDGKVSLPLIGEIAVSGSSVKGAAAIIEAALRRGFLVKPVVTVTVLEKTRERFNLEGAVGRPGPYYFPESGELTLLDAISQAGGFTRLANSKVVITRKSGSVLKVDAADRREAQRVRIFPGDHIEAKERIF
jgi:protein involved in polysaccharide export with SLBB domain